MPIAVICPSCKAKLKAPEALVGKMVKCPGCATTVLVKAAATVARTPVSVAATPKPAAKKPAPRPEILDEEEPEEVEDVLDDGDEEVEPRPKKKAKKAIRPSQSDDDVTDSERSTASFIHFGTFLNMILAPVGYAVPLFLWMTKRKDSAFIDHHGKTWLNFHISMFVLYLSIVIVGGGLAFALYFLSGWLTLILCIFLCIGSFALSIYMLIMYIIAGSKAKKGEWFEYRCLFKVLK